MITNIRHISIIMLLVISPLSYGAGVDSQMQTMFGSLSNTTPPSVQISKTNRGIISGGSFTVKNKIANLQIVAATAPSITAGCGGIDMYGGSISFPSKAQFSQLLRNIASNAQGYAFMLAINAMCGECGNIMNTIQEKVDALNRMAANSCQLAQGIVNDGLKAAGVSDKKMDAIRATDAGIMDMFDAFTDYGGQSGTDTLATAGLQTECTGDTNLMWCQLKRNSIQTQFTSGDEELLEEIMSLTGSIVNKAEGGVDPKPSPVPGILSFHDLVKGGDVTVYDCLASDPECLAPQIVSKTLKGLKERIEEVFTAPGGYIDKLNNPSGAAALTALEQNVATNSKFGWKVRRLAPSNKDGALALTELAAEHIALDMASSMIRTMVEQAKSSLINSESALAGELLKTLDNRVNELMSEERKMRQTAGSITEIEEAYSIHIQSVSYKPYYSKMADVTTTRAPGGDI